MADNVFTFYAIFQKRNTRAARCGYRKSHPGWRRCRDGLSSLGMIGLLKLLGGLLVGLFRSHAARAAEMAFLRQQLVVLSGPRRRGSG